MMKTNLLLLDSYNDLENLVEFSFLLSEQQNRRLKIVYVFDFDWMRQSYMVGMAGPSDMSMMAIEQNVKKQFADAGEKMKNVARQSSIEHAGVNYEVNVSENNRIDLVNEELKQNSDLVLLVSSRKSYTEETGGLITYPDIIDHINCPILVIPENLKKHHIHYALYASDYNPADIDALKHLSEFVPSPASSEITVMHNDAKDSHDSELKWLGFQKMVQDLLPSANIDFVHGEDKNFLKAVEKHAESSELDLLAVMKEKKGIFADLFSSSDTKKVLTTFDKLVMVYHDK